MGEVPLCSSFVIGEVLLCRGEVPLCSVSKRPASAPHMLRIVHILHPVSAYGHFPDGFKLHLLLLRVRTESEPAAALFKSQAGSHAARLLYRGTALLRIDPHVRPYSSTVPRVLGGS